MTQRSGIGSYLEQNRAEGEGPKSAYLMDKPGSPGVYELGSGSKQGEATAWLAEKSGSPGVFVMDNTSASEDRPLFVVAGKIIF